MVIVIDLQFNSMWDGSAAVGVRRGGQNAEQAGPPVAGSMQDPN